MVSIYIYILISHFTISQPILFYILNRCYCINTQEIPVAPQERTQTHDQATLLMMLRSIWTSPRFCRTGVEGSEMQLVIHVHTVLNQKKIRK